MLLLPVLWTVTFEVGVEPDVGDGGDGVEGAFALFDGEVDVGGGEDNRGVRAEDRVDTGVNVGVSVCR